MRPEELYIPLHNLALYVLASLTLLKAAQLQLQVMANSYIGHFLLARLVALVCSAVVRRVGIGCLGKSIEITKSS